MQLAEQIYIDLKKGQWGSSGQIPSFRTIASHYDCSLSVIQQAMLKLTEEGLICSLRGKGTFWANSRLNPNFRRNKILGVTYLNLCFKRELEQLKEAYLAQGWFLAGYNADMHRQDPAREKEFVLRARDEHFGGLVMLATPLAPVNTDLFAQMRLEGMKIVHLVPYQSDMTHEAYFSADYLAAGRLAAAQAARKGYQKLIFFRQGTSPDRNLNYAGAWEMGSALELDIEPDFDPEYTFNPSDEELYLNATEENMPAIEKRILALPDGCCILSQSSYLLYTIKQILNKFRPNAAIGLLALDDFVGENLPISRISYDRLLQLKEALTYASDATLVATDLVQKNYTPHYEDRGSL